MYDQGYTSLGTTKDTLPCPALAVPGTSSEGKGTLPKFWPAYMLQDWSQERAGRIKKEKKDKKKANDAPKKGAAVKETTTASQSTTPVSAPGSALSNDESQDLRDTDPKEMDAAKQTAEIFSNGSTGSPEVDDSQSCISFASNNTMTQRKAGLLIIGDEILKGTTADTNTQTAAKAFRENSVLLKRVAVVSDNLEDIVNEILTMQDEVGKFLMSFIPDGNFYSVRMHLLTI